jgi:ABC-type molybdate transport system substrate-binding protein
MNRKLFSFAFLFLAVASVACAHGTYTHVMGTVTKITDTEVTVETADKQVTVVKIASTTSFLKGGAAATLKDLKVGDRVVIHAKPIGSDLVAHEVRFGKTPAADATH